MRVGVVERWRHWNRHAYLSPGEARLNRSLWFLLWASLGYSVLQHVLLADRPAFSQWAFHAGELCYDLAIAYAGAFVFYLLVVRLPLRRDRRNMYSRMAYDLRGPRDRAIELIRYLNTTAGLVGEYELDDRKVTRENIAELCAALTPSKTAHYWTPTGRVQTTALGLMGYQVDRVRHANKELIMDWSTYLPTDAIDYLEAIDDCYFLHEPEGTFPRIEQGLVDADANIAWIADELFTYLRLVDRFDKWRAQFAPVVGPPPGLPADEDEELLTSHYNYNDAR